MIHAKRADDTKLKEIIESQLKPYIIDKIPSETLEKTVNLLIYEIRASSRNSKNKQIINDEYIWIKTNKQLLYLGKEIELTYKEKEFLALLFSNIHKVFHYDIITLHIWDSIENSKKNSLKTIVKQIRQKLPTNIIKNIFNLGYKIEITN